MTGTEQNWFLFDGECGMCRRLTERWRKTLEARGFQIATLQDDWVSKRTGMSKEELVKEVRILADGRLISGAEAYLDLMKRIGWLRLFGYLFSLPGLKAIFSFGYRFVANHRKFFSRFV